MVKKDKTFPKYHNGLVIVLIILLTILVYANSLMNSFVWDDYAVIVDNDFIKYRENLPLIFSKKYLSRSADLDYLTPGKNIGSGESSYRPVVTLSYFLDYYLWRLKPFGYHLTNLVLHILNIILLYFLISMLAKNEAPQANPSTSLRMVRRNGERSEPKGKVFWPRMYKKIALLACLLFALHPANSETVGIISFREDLLVFLFYISSFILFIKSDKYGGGKKIIFYTASALFFFLALFSKEMAVTLPLIMVLYDYSLKKNPNQILSSFGSRYLGYIIVLLFYLSVRFFLIANPDKPLVAYPMTNFYTRLLTMSSAFGNYALWMLFPINIHPTLPDDPSLISYSLFEPRVIVSVSLIIILLGIALKIRKRLTLFFFAILWFFITLIPVSGVFFNLTNYAASRYLYLPIAGFCLLIAGLILELPNFKIFSIQPAILKKTARSIILISVLTYSIFTVIRNMGWRNNIVFGLEIAEIYPNNAVAHSWLGNIFLKNGFFDKALYEYKIALSLNPNYAGDENNLGLCYYKKGLLDEAIAQFKKTIELDPNFLQAYINLGSALGDKGLYQEAMNGTLKDKGLYQEAMDCFNQVLKIDPQNIQAYNALGVTFARIKEWAKARKSWEMAIKIYPKNKEAQENLEKLKQLGY